MKALLFLCVSAALVHVAILYDGYLKLKVNNHYPPVNPQDYIYMIVAFKTAALDGLYDALEDPDSSVRPTQDITIFIDNKWHPQNPNILTVSKDFSSPEAAMNSVNAFVKEKTSGKIDNLVGNLNDYTVTAIVNTNNALKVPSAGGSGWTKQLDGQYKMVENKALGVTVIEIPYSRYLSILLAIPSPGKEEEVGKSLTSPTIEALRKSMTLQKVRMEVPRATIYAASFMAVDIVPLDDEELIRTRYGYKVAMQLP
ncbi:serpin A12-like [Lithobates pipiens]